MNDMDPTATQHQQFAESSTNEASSAARKRKIEGSMVPQTGPQGPVKQLEDPTQYPRKRVSVACEICRVRKTRCDAARPSCSFCSSLGVQCVYRKPSGVIANLMTRAKQGERFQTLQSRLESLENVIATGAKVPPTPPSEGRGSSTATSHDFSPRSVGIEPDFPTKKSAVATPLQPRIPSDEDARLPLLGLARCLGNLSRLHGHPTPAELHLSDYDDCEQFMESELHQGDLIYQAANKHAIDLSPRVCWSYQQAFVKDVLPWFPIFSQDTCVNHVAAAQASNFADACPSTPIALYAFALGAFAKAADTVTGDDPQEFPGLNYFAAAREIAGPQGIRNAIEVIQSQILRTLYYCMCMRPLAACDSILPASRSLVSLLHLKRHLSQDIKFRHACHRAYWACFIIEKELKPYSAACTPGFEALSGSTTLPLSSHEEPGMLWFLSEIALRRIFVNVGGSEINTTYEPLVTEEIVGQLFRWYEGLPPGVRFGQGHAPILDPQKAFLRAQFYSVLFVSKWSSVVALFTPNLVTHCKTDPASLESASQALEYGVLYINAVESSTNDRHVLLFANFIGTFCISALLLSVYGLSQLDQLRTVDLYGAVSKAYGILWPWRANPNVGAKIQRLNVMLAEKGLPKPTLGSSGYTQPTEARALG